MCANLCYRIGQLDIFQCFVIAKCILTNFIQWLAEANSLKCLTIMERIVSYSGHWIGQNYFGKHLAVIKCIFPNLLYRIAKLYVFERYTIPESAFVDFGDRVGNDNTGQFRAIQECAIPDTCYWIAQFNISQCRTVNEWVFPDNRCWSTGDSHFVESSAIPKCRFTDCFKVRWGDDLC